MFFGSGEDLAKMLMKKTTVCPKCGQAITFEEAAMLAKDHGIQERAVMCKGCNSVYTATLTPELVLIKDITANYFG